MVWHILFLHDFEFFHLSSLSGIVWSDLLLLFIASGLVIAMVNSVLEQVLLNNDNSLIKLEQMLVGTLPLLKVKKRKYSLMSYFSILWSLSTTSLWLFSRPLSFTDESAKVMLQTYFLAPLLYLLYVSLEKVMCKSIVWDVRL